MRKEQKQTTTETTTKKKDKAQRLLANSVCVCVGVCGVLCQTSDDDEAEEVVALEVELESRGLLCTSPKALPNSSGYLRLARL